MMRRTMNRLNKEEMAFRPLFFLQERLDEKINSRFHSDEEIQKEHFQKKVLAFRVEVAELLNTLRLHKYWSTKEPESKERILEEYADGFHFLLSIGGEKDISDFLYTGLYDGELTERDIVWLFEKLITIPWMELKKDDFRLGLEMYLKLGELLGFTWQEIKEAYVAKNLENQTRQETGY